MKKTVLITTIAIIFFLLVLQQSTFAYDEGEVICTISSFITGVKSQGALYSETALGDFAADALREAGKTDIAVVNGGDLIHVLDQGPVTYGEVVDVFTENKPAAIAVVTAEDIWDMLEHGVENIVLGENCRISDFTFISLKRMPASTKPLCKSLKKTVLSPSAMTGKFTISTRVAYACTYSGVIL